MAIRSICLVEYVHDVILVLLRAEIHCTICQRNLLKAHLEAQKYCKSVLDLQSAIVTHINFIAYAYKNYVEIITEFVG